MTDPFHSHIQEALANPVLQDALDGNAQRRIQGRLQALASLDDPQAMRQRAHAVRAEAIANLDRYLDRFIEQAQANGDFASLDASERRALHVRLPRPDAGLLRAVCAALAAGLIPLHKRAVP